VLGDTTRLQQQLNNIKTNFNLTINNNQALQAIQQVQTQINNLRTSMSNLNLNIGGNGSGSNGGAGGGSSNAGRVGAILNANQQFQTSTKAVTDVQSVISNLNSQINGTVSRLQLCTDETGRIIGGTAQITQGATTWTRSIEQARDTQGQVIEGQYRLTEQGRVVHDITKKNNGSLSQQLKIQFKQYAIYYAVSSLIQGIVDGISNGVDYAIDLNDALTNIRVVTMDTKKATEDLLKMYNQMGQDLGANTLDIAEGAVDWLRQGYNEADTAELVKDSTILSKLALIDNAEATEYLTSALKGYKLEAKDAIGVIDQLVSIDLEAATSSGDMAEAMSRTANMARTTGFEMNELLGMIATMSEVTQNSASTIGNSVKTILSRMSNVKAGLDDFEGEALNDVEKTLNRVGIALRDNQGNWYDFYDVLDEIASKWDTFSDVQQSQITTALGGTRQRENILVA
jgi:TP901 family phage tail tape measure protein